MARRVSPCDVGHRIRNATQPWRKETRPSVGQLGPSGALWRSPDIPYRASRPAFPKIRFAPIKLFLYGLERLRYRPWWVLPTDAGEMIVVRVLFVCMGNICRSPVAEGVTRALVEETGLGEHIHIESAGTHGWHVGDPPDPRSIESAARRGVDISAQRSRKIKRGDFTDFDYLLAMDRDNMAELNRMAPGDASATVRLFLSFGNGAARAEVPDPYYGAGDGFEVVLDLVDDAARGLLDHLRAAHQLAG